MERKTLGMDGWLRREEEVAKARQENPNLWDVGVGKDFQRTFPSLDMYHLVEQLLETVKDGVYVIHMALTHHVYVFRESNRKRLEIGLRSDFVALWGEEDMAKIDADIFGKGKPPLA
jgi:hypothetical protein